MRARKSMLTTFQGNDALPPLISVTIRDAVLLTGICRSKLYELIQQEILPIRKIGRTTLVPYDALCALIGRSTGVHSVTSSAGVDATGQRTSASSSDATAMLAHRRPASRIVAQKSARNSRGSKASTSIRTQGSFFDLFAAP